MRLQSQLFYLWKETDVCKRFRTGISLHSHTNLSCESLSFLWKIGKDFAPLQWLLATQQKKAAAHSSVQMDLGRAYWTPPVSPRLVHESECSQIEDELGLQGLVSMTDHDSVEAALRLRVLESHRHTPISVEWSVPFNDAVFHLGIHNLPHAQAASFMVAFEQYRVAPTAARLMEILQELNSIRQVLVIFNHPLWNLHGLEQDRYNFLVGEFLCRYSACLHGLELNGLRPWKENQAVTSLASAWNQLVISGGDRHGCEPNANVNLSSATSFNEFVDEIRRQRLSRVMFMRHYAEPLAFRYFQSLLDVIQYNPSMPEGMRNWDDRTFHPDRDGEIKPLSALWKSPPAFLDRMFRMATAPNVGTAAHRLRRSLRKELALEMPLSEFNSSLSSGLANQDRAS